MSPSTFICLPETWKEPMLRKLVHKRIKKAARYLLNYAEGHRSSEAYLAVAEDFLVAELQWIQREPEILFNAKSDHKLPYHHLYEHLGIADRKNKKHLAHAWAMTALYHQILLPNNLWLNANNFFEDENLFPPDSLDDDQSDDIFIDNVCHSQYRKLLADLALTAMKKHP